VQAAEVRFRDNYDALIGGAGWAIREGEQAVYNTYCCAY
jgi:hypothetical protein